MLRDSIFLMAFSIAGIFFLKADHCSSVKLIPETQPKLEFGNSLQLFIEQHDVLNMEKKIEK